MGRNEPVDGPSDPDLRASHAESASKNRLIGVGARFSGGCAVHGWVAVRPGFSSLRTLVDAVFAAS